MKMRSVLKDSYLENSDNFFGRDFVGGKPVFIQDFQEKDESAKISKPIFS